jgi:hypothetical protein
MATIRHPSYPQPLGVGKGRKATTNQAMALESDGIDERAEREGLCEASGRPGGIGIHDSRIKSPRLYR